jgi:diketogulonate reductase-like aldo/keto reductase
MLHRPIPSTNEMLPVIGLGTWKVFDVNEPAYPALVEVLETMKRHGATVIDSSPMYGKSESVTGNLTAGPALKDAFFYATKVWIEGREAGVVQMEASMQKMGRERMDLIQVHNLVDMKTHFTTLRKWKEEGKVRYIGITHYTDSMHETLERIISQEQIDFVQFNYSVFATHAEKRLLSAAAAHGVATLINRPFGEGGWFGKVKNTMLPEWAGEMGIKNWSQYFLKYIIAHPAVTCVIPGTGNASHMKDNIEAAEGTLPDAAQLRKMKAFIDNL